MTRYYFNYNSTEPQVNTWAYNTDVWGGSPAITQYLPLYDYPLQPAPGVNTLQIATTGSHPNDSLLLRYTTTMGHSSNRPGGHLRMGLETRRATNTGTYGPTLRVYVYIRHTDSRPDTVLVLHTNPARETTAFNTIYWYEWDLPPVVYGPDDILTVEVGFLREGTNYGYLWVGSETGVPVSDGQETNSDDLTWMDLTWDDPIPDPDLVSPLRVYREGLWTQAVPKVYLDNEWKTVSPKSYRNNEWK